jgi:hypothetical protein
LAGADGKESESTVDQAAGALEKKLAEHIGGGAASVVAKGAATFAVGAIDKLATSYKRPDDAPPFIKRCDGWLQKQGGIIKNWKTRCVSLLASVISFR